MEYSFDIPVKIRIAKPPEFQSAIVDLARKKVCVFLTSTNMVQRLGLSEFINTLKTECKFQLIEYSVTNPTEVDIKNVVDKIEQLPELIIALGGGSILDLAKAVSAFSYMIEDTTEVEEITAAIKIKKYLQYTSKIELAAVATTSGTGSEVTRWATIWNYEHEEKFSIEAEWLLPKYAFVVPVFTQTLPARQTLSTGLDALMHAVESYWSVNSNAIVREIAKSAIRLVVDYLPKLLQELDNLQYREKLSLASLMAGLAFGNTRTTACHSISYPLTMDYGVEHGFAAAVTLIELIRFNQEYIVDYPLLMEAFHCPNIEGLEKWLYQLTRNIQPCSLKSLGIKKEDIPVIVKKSFTLGRINNNPRYCGEKELSFILNSSFNKE